MNQDELFAEYIRLFEEDPSRSDLWSMYEQMTKETLERAMKYHADRLLLLLQDAILGPLN